MGFRVRGLGFHVWARVMVRSEGVWALCFSVLNAGAPSDASESLQKALNPKP